jgi:hypothetical protein
MAAVELLRPLMAAGVERVVTMRAAAGVPPASKLLVVEAEGAHPKIVVEAEEEAHHQTTVPHENFLPALHVQMPRCFPEHLTVGASPLELVEE